MKRRLTAASMMGIVGAFVLSLREIIVILRTHRYLFESDLQAWKLGLQALALYGLVGVPLLVVGSLILSFLTRRWGANDDPDRSMFALSVAGVLFVVFGAWIKIHWITVSLAHPVSLLFFAGLAVVAAVAGAAALRFCTARGSNSKTRLVNSRVFPTVLLLWLFITVPFLQSGADVVLRDESHGANRRAGLSAPNVLWIVIDTLRADHLSCYGYDRETTPAIDQLAREGTLFENASATAPWTLPSHASMFTGMFPSKHNAVAAHRYLTASYETVTEVLRQHGYQTAAFSNNANISPQTNLTQGFDFLFQGHLLTNTGIERPADALLFWRIFYKLSGSSPNRTHGAEVTNRAVRSWLAGVREPNEPFFLFVHYMEPHAPYGPPQGYARLYAQEEASPAARSAAQNPYAAMAGRVDLSQDDLDLLRAWYDGEIRYVDTQVGELLREFERRGSLDDTLVILTSDHGENFGEHGQMGHQFSLYETLIHVPLIVRYPRLFGAGERRKDLVQLTDLYPTILEAVGAVAENADDIQGRNLTEIRTDGLPISIAEYDIFGSKLEGLLALNWAFDYAPYARNLRSLRDDRFKYIWASDGRSELYRIDLDKAEERNVIDVEPDAARALSIRLEQWLASFTRPDVDAVQAPVEMDEETRERLKTLGYL